MYPLLVCSLLAGAAVVYKYLTLRRSTIMPESLVRRVECVVRDGEGFDELRENARTSSSVLGDLVLTILESKTKSIEQVKELVQSQAKEEFVRLQSGIPVLDMVINIAPMFGILGTASGLVVVFGSFGDEGNQSQVAVGIARALNTTIAGLAIAAPSVVFHMYFSRRLERMAVRMETLTTELVDACVEHYGLGD